MGERIARIVRDDETGIDIRCEEGGRIVAAAFAAIGEFGEVFGWFTRGSLWGPYCRDDLTAAKAAAIRSLERIGYRVEPLEAPDGSSGQA